MRLAYPGAFLLMGSKARCTRAVSRDVVLAGLLLFGWAKALKFWVMPRWAAGGRSACSWCRDAPLVTAGPYRFAAPSELRRGDRRDRRQCAIALSAPVAGVVACVDSRGSCRRRIAVEERALGLR